MQTQQKKMGVSLCPSRRIDDVEFADIVNSAKQTGVLKKIAFGQLEELRDGFEKALDQAENELVAQAIPEASLIASHIREEWKRKSRGFRGRRLSKIRKVRLDK